jgi:hypothetical protein
MDMSTSPRRGAFCVLAVFLSDGVKFAHEEYVINVARHVSPDAAARARAEESPYTNGHVPGLSIFLIVTPCMPPEPEPRPPLTGADTAHDIEVGCYLVLSTLHIRCSTAVLLDKWSELPAIGQPIAASRTNYGWFIPSKAGPMPPPVLPSEFEKLLRFARSKGCAHILFDCDGPIEPSLPTFPW